jgi:glycosyltransferase involved in cell wall biosynthesis
VRILHLTDHYPPVLGGIEAYVAGLARRQRARGDDVTVLTSTPDERKESPAASSHVRVVRARSLREGAAVDFATFDVAHAHVSVVAPFSAPLAGVAARSGVPTVVTVHSMWNGLGPLPAMAASVAGLRSAPVAWTAVSRVAAEQLAPQLPQGTQVSVVPNAVDTRSRARTPRQRHDHSVQLVSTMRLARRKRPLQLVRMFASLQGQVDLPLGLTVVGDGPLLRPLERLLARAGLETAVTLAGRVEPAQVVELLGAADVYVAPSIRESFGLAALEARCVGLPVVGHAASGLTDFIEHGVEGFLCRSDADMVAALRLLALDDAMRRRISEHNRTVDTDMTWTNSLSRHDQVYAEATRSFSGLPPRGLPRHLRSTLP